jgi:hypothetical protein
VLYDFILAKYSFPLTEGWWELLARESSSKVLYKDIFIGLPPLYINFIAALQKITSNFYHLRIIFIAIHIAEFLLITFLIRKFFSFRVAICSALISELLIISYNSAYLPKDYHLFLSVFVILTLIFLVQYQEGINKYKNIIFAGIFTGIILLTKQNIGALLFFSSLIFIACNVKNIISFLKHSFVYIVLAIATLILYTQLNGLDWLNVFIGNDSKGSIFKVLTRFLSEEITKLTILQLIVAYVVYVIWQSKDAIKSKYFIYIEKINPIFLINLNKYCFFLMNGYFLFLGIRISQNRDFVIAGSLIFTILIINVFLLIKYNKNKFFLVRTGAFSLVILFLCYGNSMTAGYNFVGMQVGFAFLFAIILQSLERLNAKLFFVYGAMCLVIITNSFVKNRFVDGGNAYSWWGYSIGQVSKNTHQYKNPYLNGLMLSLETKEILEEVNGIITSSGNNKNYYFYPNIPIFYYIFNLSVHTQYPILWFDVIPSSKKLDILNEFNKINPDYIFWLKPIDEAYLGHYRLKGSTSVMSELDDEMLTKIEKGFYKQIFVKPVGLFDSESKASLRRINVKMICNTCTSSDLQGLLHRGEIIDIDNYNERVTGREYWSVIFKNSNAYIDFCKKFNPIILNRDNTLFIVLKKS